MAPPQANDEILIPAFDGNIAGTPLTVTWSQNLSTRTAQYYNLTADNITTGEQFPIFVGAEYYKSSTVNNPKHVTKVGETLAGEGYKVKIDNRFQYGQKNAEGELRFVVYHDQERKPYQHRFIETAIGSAGADKASKLATQFGFGGTADMVSGLAKNFVGDYLTNMTRRGLTNMRPNQYEA